MWVILLLSVSAWAINSAPPLKVHPPKVILLPDVAPYLSCYQGPLSPLNEPVIWNSCDSHSPNRWTSNHFWWKIQLKHQGASNLQYLHVLTALEDSIFAWVLYQDSLVATAITGSMIPLEKRSFPHRSNAIPVHFNDSGIYTVILHVYSSNPFSTSVSIIPEAHMNHTLQEGIRVMYPYTGAAIAVFFINFLMFLVLRERTYIPYILFHINLVLATLIVTGHSIQLLPQNPLGWARFFPYFLSIAGLLFLDFTSIYFKESFRKKPLYMVLGLLALSNIPCAILGLPYLYTQELFFFTTLILVFDSIRHLRTQRLHALFYLISWGGYCTFILIYLLTSMSVLPNLFFFKYGAIIAHVWEMSAFTVAIANKIWNNLQIARQQAIHNEQIATSLLQKIAHELRTPLTGIIGEIHNLRSQDSTLPLSNVEQSTYTMTHILNNIIDMQDFLPHQCTPNPMYTRVDFILADLLKQQQTRNSGTLVQSHIPSNLSEYWLDPILLEKLWFQIIDNAFKYGKGYPVRVDLIGDTKDLTLLVRNYCLKDPTAQFTPNQALTFSSTAVSTGMGVGLQIARKAGQLLNANLEFKFIGKSVLVTCTLPVSRFRQPHSLSPTDATKSILIVDDVAMNRKMLDKLCTRMGHYCKQAPSGLSAIKQVIRSRPSIVLLDIQMPILDGLGTCKLIRRYEKKYNIPPVPIIAVTAHGTTTYEQTCLGVGMNAMLSKPVHYEVLRSTLDAY